MEKDIPNRFIIESEGLIGEWNWNERERCIVCNLLIHGNESIGRCPECGHAAHLDHFQEWIKIKGICPFCKRKIKFDKLVRE